MKINATWTGILALVCGAIAVFAMLLELFSKLGIDNLTVPLGNVALS